MAEYRAKISLLNINDGEDAVSVVSVNTYYAISLTSDRPPDDELYTLILESGLLQLKPNRGVNLYFKNNTLLASRDGEELDLKVEESLITGASGSWSEEMPEPEPGSYTWSKTSTTYTDNTAHVVYSVSRIGADGEKGDQGIPGEVELYSIRTNQKEILKFADSIGSEEDQSEGEILLSPEILEISIYKVDPYAEDESGERKITEGLSISNLNLVIYSAVSSEIYEINEILKEKYITYDEILGDFKVDLASIITDPEKGDFGAALLDQETTMEISYSYKPADEEKVYSFEKYIQIRFGMTKDMASLVLKANGLVASMQDSKLIFNSNGLTVQNGNFVIQRTKKNDEGIDTLENVLYADDEGNLVLTGIIHAQGGEFKGAIEATSGTFKESTIESGSIGGFVIENSKLTSEATKKEDGEDIPCIVLDGTTGLIVAENITLGTGAQIKKYIQVGNFVKIKKPDSPGDSFISVTDPSNESHEILCLKSNGIMNIGYEDNMIIINGKDGSIMTNNYDDGLGWKITNKVSVFNDVSVRGSIHASVLEYGEVQAVGGAILVRPSSRIKGYSVSQDSENEEIFTTTLTLESTVGFQVDDWCRIDSGLTKSFYKVLSVSETEIVVDGNTNNVQGYPIVDFGHTDENGKRAIGIGLNGSSDSNDSLIVPHALSVFEFDEETRMTFPKIILGKLPENDIYGAISGSYGLYAENVLLKGSLVTQSRDQNGNKIVYSGINTLFSSDAPLSSNNLIAGEYFGDSAGEILIWAGSVGDDKKDIEQANFFVDKNGNLFAGRGYFDGTIITNSTISASEIQTAVLTGTGPSPALTIKDATRGIHFVVEEDGITKTVFEVSKDKVSVNVPTFELNNDFQIGESGSLVVPNLFVAGENNVNGSESLMLNKTRISYASNFIGANENNVEDSSIEFSDGIDFLLNGNKKMQIDNQNVQIHSSLLIQNTIQYGESMNYQPVKKDGKLIGYDLYID